MFLKILIYLLWAATNISMKLFLPFYCYPIKYIEDKVDGIWHGMKGNEGAGQAWELI